MSDRRYNEEEVALIFERATDAEPVIRRQIASGSGMTLAELQDIGREVGISPEAVAHAAGSLVHVARPAPSRTFLGLPIGVGRTVELGRRLSDEEWERLVVDLRETFDARGRVHAQGSLRQWTNGNLQALLEPTPDGHRLRLRTVKGNSRMLMTAGLGLIGVAAASLIAAGGIGDAGTLGLLGLGMFGAGALRLPGWARLRRRQMEAITSRLALPATPQTDELPGKGE
jgi:hypothetical protein